MNSLRFLLPGNRLYLAILIAIILFTASFSIVMPLSFALAVDVLLPQGYRFHLFVLIGAVLTLTMIRFLLNLVQDYLFQKIRMKAEINMISAFAKSVICRPEDIDVQRDNIDAENWLRLWLVNFQRQSSEILYFLSYAVFIAAVVFAILFWVDPVIALITSVFAVLHYANFRFHNSRSKAQSDVYSRQKASFMSDVNAALNGKRAINVALLDSSIESGLAARAESAFKAAFRQVSISNSQGFFQSILRGSLFLTLVVYAYPRVAAGEMTAGGLFVTLLLVSFAYEPIYRLNKVTMLYNQMMSCLRPLSEMIKEDEPLTYSAPAEFIPEKVVMSDLRLRASDRILFDNLTAKFERGKIYLIKGPSGSGKSSVLRLVSGLAKPESGAVLWDAYYPGDLAQGDKARLVSTAPQSPLLFDASIAENLSMFEREPDESRIASLLAELGLAGKCADLHERVTPELFSSGQLQRLALARALYRDGPILILDEPTANLDQDMEKRCLEAIRVRKHNRITILVSHGDNAVSIADEIIDLSKRHCNA